MVCSVVIASLLGAPGRADAAGPVRPRVIVEISPKAERFVDGRSVRRLVEVELSDAEVPLRPGESNSARPSVYFRILATTPETLRIELWDKGDFYGARKLGSRDVKELVARRIALAAAALVRDMRSRRVLETNAAAAAARQRASERAALADAERWPAVTVTSRGLGAVVGPGDVWLAGVGLGGELRLKSRTRVELGAAWLFGGVPAAGGEPSERWLELGVSPMQGLELAPGFDLALGFSAAAAAVHYTRVRSVDGEPGELDTWSARAVARVLAEPRLGRIARLSVGPELGAVLRRVSLVDNAGESQRLGGLWLGLSVGIALDPLGRL